jgi:hypothetical protein
MPPNPNKVIAPIAAIVLFRMFSPSAKGYAAMLLAYFQQCSISQ